jgi:hypothetical protein
MEITWCMSLVILRLKLVNINSFEQYLAQNII